MPFLVVISGDPGERKLEIGADITVGRASDNLLSIDDPSVSGHHCRITRTGDSFVVRDLGSTNGTLVNDVSVRSVELNSGDLITVGSAELLFRDPGVEDSPEPSVPTTSSPENAGPSFAALRNSSRTWIPVIIAVGVMIVLACLVAMVLFGPRT